MRNHWIDTIQRNKISKEIDERLLKYVGAAVEPFDVLLAKLRHIVRNYFRGNPHHIKFFSSSSERLEYRFDIQDKDGKVTSIRFRPK